MGNKRGKSYCFNYWEMELPRTAHFCSAEFAVDVKKALENLGPAHLNWVEIGVILGWCRYYPHLTPQTERPD